MSMSPMESYMIVIIEVNLRNPASTFNEKCINLNKNFWIIKGFIFAKIYKQNQDIINYQLR